MTTRFSTPLARDLFQMGVEGILEEHRFGYLHSFSNKPVTLPSADPKAVSDELGRLERTSRHEWRGTPGEL